jgi:hypothetical protein
MRQAARITLFIHDRDGLADMVPDLEVLHLLLAQMPLTTQNPDGSRTVVFDLVNPRDTLMQGSAPIAQRPSLERLRDLCQSLANEARSLGLPRAAGLAESVEMVAESEIASRWPTRLA